MSPGIGEPSAEGVNAARLQHETGEEPGASPTSRGAQRPDSIMRRHKRTATSTEEIENTISHPGSVRINVEGAFIVDSGSSSPSASSTGCGCPTNDIRLPNHRAVVGHIAVDVSLPPLFRCPLYDALLFN